MTRIMKQLLVMFVLGFFAACAAETGDEPVSVEGLEQDVTNGTYNSVAATRTDGTQYGTYKPYDDINVARTITNMYLSATGYYWRCGYGDAWSVAICSNSWYQGAPISLYNCQNVNEGGYTRKCGWGIGIATVGYVWSKPYGTSWIGLASFTGTGQFATLSGANHSAVVSGP